jgi:surface polysaccharide O-acyltransferase-like enzyme
MISQLYIITPLLQYINRKRYGLVLVLILNIVSLLALYLSRVYNIIGHLPAALPFYSWIIFYEIGLLTGSGDYKTFVPKNMRFFILPALLVSLLASELEGMILLLKYDNLDFAVSSTKYSSFFYSVCIILGFLFVRERIRYWPKSLVSIGHYSFGIYLMHVPVLNQVTSLVQKSSTIYSFQPLYQFIVVTLTILICLVIINITRRLLPTSFCVKVLGF